MRVSSHSRTFDLGPLSQVPLGEGRLFDVAGRRVAVFHLRSGGVAATSAICPHRNGPLADGIVGGGVLVCPLHQRKYDLETGACLSAEGEIEVYQAHVDDEGRIKLCA